jgi:hypothetical protein
VQEALVVDVRDDQTDLVDVADDRERRAAGRARDAPGRGAHDVGGDLGELARGLAPCGGRRGLVSGRSRGGQERLQDGRDRHASGD